MRLLHGVCTLLGFMLVVSCAAPPPLATVTLTAIVPPLASISGGTTVQLHGQGYVPGTRVLFGDVPAVVLLDSPELLSVVVPPWLQRQGLVPVRVLRPDGPVVSREDLFTYYQLLGSPETRLTADPELRAVVVADVSGDYETRVPAAAR